MARAHVAIIAILCSWLGGFTREHAPQDIWRVGRRVPERAILLTDPSSTLGLENDDAIDSFTLESPMLARLAGAAGVLDRDAIRRLPGTVIGAARSTDPDLLDSERRLIVRLIARDASKDVEILHAPNGRAAARELSEGGMGTAVWLDRSAFDGIISTTGHYLGPIENAALPHETGEIFELAHPLTTGWFHMTSPLLGKRMFPGMRVRVRGSFRELDREILTCRLPKGYDPRNPAGLLVWIDPTDIGEPPTQLHAATDELNLIIVGARNAPNDRFVADRMQLGFDGVATACERFHVDESRIYLTGMSGGGRASSMLWLGFPDVFAGAVPIVGLNHYRQITVDGKDMAAGSGRPSGWQLHTLKTRRIAPMTGPIDFNYEEMRIRSTQLENDGFDIRFFEYEDMGHTMPTAPRFYDAMAWVDEPWQIARDESIAKARELLAQYEERFSQGSAARLPRACEMLVEITRIAPWSEPAWEAVELLRKKVED